MTDLKLLVVMLGVSLIMYLGFLFLFSYWVKGDKK